MQSLLLSFRALCRSILQGGPGYVRCLRHVRQIQWNSERQIEHYIQQKLHSILCFSLKNIPFYRDLNICPPKVDRDARNVLEKFPVIDKEVVRREWERLLPEKPRWPVFTVHTSGTTGTPLRLKRDLASIRWERAFLQRQLDWAGYRAGGRRAWLRGDLIVPVDRSAPPYWRLDFSNKMLVLSSYHLSVDTVGLYLDQLEKYDPVVIHAYPSAIHFVASWMCNNNIKYSGRSLVAVLTSSETVTDSLRRTIESAFGCQVFDWYGQTERVAAIGTCSAGRMHLLSDYSFIELDHVGDNLYEIIGTGLYNFAMPLIRYRTGDVVKIINGFSDKCGCGLPFPVVDAVVGRQDDVVLLPDGREIGRLDHVFKGITHIIEGQIVQERPDLIVLQIVPADGFGRSQEKRLVRQARERLGREIRIEVKLVDALERTASGKMQNVIRRY